MVSNASDDLPEPETPVTTVSWLCGISKSMFFRLWTRAPRTMMLSFDMAQHSATPQILSESGAETFDYIGWQGEFTTGTRRTRTRSPTARDDNVCCELCLVNASIVRAYSAFSREAYFSRIFFTL